MSKIRNIKGLEILDSRGNPTVEVILTLENGIQANAKVPSGASTGEHEAVELRDKDDKRYNGKGVLKAVENVNGPLKELLIGEDVLKQKEIDYKMIDADGSENKKNFGANAILGVSLAVAKAAAKDQKLPLYQHLAKDKPVSIPCPMMNIINGGAHADSMLDFQEFMIRPKGAPTFREALRYGAEVFVELKKLLKAKNMSISVGDEGGFAPNLSNNEETLSLIIQAIEKAGYKPHEQISIALDPAASEFYDKESFSYIEKKKKLLNQQFQSRTSEEQVEYLKYLTEKFPIDSIEDGLDENDWDGWELLTRTIGDKIQLVGDDIFVTNPKFLERAIDTKVGNSILIKLNQIGTLTETLETIDLAHKNNYTTVISHRSGETEDTFIADLAVATNSGQIKTGSLCRSDRVAKYNRLLEIESLLGAKAKFFDSNKHI